MPVWIFLMPPFEEQLIRIKNRNRTQEAKIDVEYYRSINLKYENFITILKDRFNIPVYVNNSIETTDEIIEKISNYFG